MHTSTCVTGVATMQIKIAFYAFHSIFRSIPYPDSNYLGVRFILITQCFVLRSSYDIKIENCLLLHLRYKIQATFSDIEHKQVANLIPPCNSGSIILTPHLRG